MENIIKIGIRGKIEIENYQIKCFLGKNDNYKSSEEIYNELKVSKPNKMKSLYELDGEKYLIIYPILEKKISVITNDGKSYKSLIYFVDDIKNIINCLNMSNACYFIDGKYVSFKTDNDFACFLYDKGKYEIKDVNNEQIIDFTKLEKEYNDFKIEDSNLLLKINKNIYLYSKIKGIEKENYFITASRASLYYRLNSFYENKKREEVSDLIYGIFGNYASGKSIFLIYYNYSIDFPTIYLNLKILKNAFRTENFPDLLNNELMILFHKLNKSYDEFKNFISKFLPYEKQDIENLIISIIDGLKNEEILIIFDQYKEELFIGQNFIKKLKKILFDKKSKFKVVISSSMNDGPIRSEYLNIILNSLNLSNENETIENNEEESEEEEKEEEEKKEEEGNEKKIEIEKKVEKKSDKMEEKENKEKVKEKDEKVEGKGNKEKMKEKVKEKKEIKENKNEESNNRTNNFIPYHFVERLVDEEQIKENIKEIKKQDDETFNNCLKLFNYLPLYYTLCRQHYKNLKVFIDKTKKRIEDKIKAINKNEKFNLKNFDCIRKMIDNEITIKDLIFYQEYIPFKYFYIEIKDKKIILRVHFPLVKDVWNNIIMKETVNLFDGEIQYDGNIIGSLLELNLIINIKNKVIKLDIDSFVKVDEIYKFEKIIESDANNYKDKNIFITQNKQNGEYFDFAFIEGKNQIYPKLIFIQVKKSLSKNKVNKQQMYKVFEQYKNNFFNLFGFIPEFENINLIYISLINNQIKQTILVHCSPKRDKFKKVSDLGNDVNSVVYSVNALYNFCYRNNINLYYYEPKQKLFYIKKNNNFEPSNLDFSIENKNEFNIIFDNSYLINDFEKNKSNSATINVEYEKSFLNKKRVKPFSYKIDDEFDIGKVFEFAENYFNKVNIINYINLNKVHLDCKYYKLSSCQAILCYKIKGKEYEIDSFICNNYLIKCENNSLKLNNIPALDRDNDFLVIISFDSMKSSLNEFLSKKIKFYNGYL